MTLFKKAEVIQAKLKLGNYGGAGTGKTYLDLILGTALGKVVLIDTEHGSDFYGSKFKFDVLHTRSLAQINEALDEIEKSDYDVVIIDSITHIWEGVQNAYIEKLRVTKKREELQFQDWRYIKRPYKDFILRLLNLDKHVIISGRMAIEYSMAKGELTKTGERMKAESETPYEPHILLKLEQHRNGKETEYHCFVEKDRSGILAGKTFVNVTAKDFQPLIQILHGKQPKIESEEEQTAKDSKLFREPVEDNSKSNGKRNYTEFWEFVKDRGYKNTQVWAWTEEKYQTRDISKLTDDQYDELHHDIEKGLVKK